MTSQVTPQSILQFWFEECTPKQHFQKNPEFDALIDERFGATIEAALNGELDDWAETQEGALALILLLDQFTRNVYRGTARAFAGDPKALSICALCIEKEYLSHPDLALDIHTHTPTNTHTHTHTHAPRARTGQQRMGRPNGAKHPQRQNAAKMGRP